MVVTGKNYYAGGWYWSLAAPHCFYAPYYPQGYFLASVGLKCDSETGKWVLFMNAQALVAYLQNIPDCPYSPWQPYQQATCYYGWEGVVSVSVDDDGKFQGEVEAPLDFLHGSGAGCCGANCTITLKFN